MDKRRGHGRVRRAGEIREGEWVAREGQGEGKEER